MTDWKQANRMLSEGYETRVPDYDLTPVLELIAGIDPKQIASAMTEAIISLTDEMLIGNRVSNSRTQETMTVLKAVFRAFDGIEYNHDYFLTQIGEQITNGEGIYASEPSIDYPLRD